MKTRYCALTTLPSSMRSFMLPSSLKLADGDFEVTIGCKEDKELEAELPSHIKYLPLKIERGFSFRGTLQAIWQLFRYFKKNKIQMVEYGTENVSFCGSIAAYLARVPVRIYNHWGARYIGYSKGFSRSFSKFIEKTCGRLSTEIRQTSELNRQMCIHDRIYKEEKVKVLGYGGTIGVDFNKFNINKKEQWRNEIRTKYGIGKNDFVFGDVCSIRKDKGSNELITAFRNLELSDAWLILVGGIFEQDPIEPELLEWAQKSDKVIFTGFTSEVYKYISAFDCLVHPSYREGFGMVLQEAGALGVPYITTNIPGPMEFGTNGETGFFVNSKDTDSLYEKMFLLYAERELLKKLSDGVFKLTKEKYERNVMVNRIVKDREELKIKYLSKNV